MPTLKLSGRKDLEDYFSKSGVFNAPKLSHTPFLVFLVSDDLVDVKIIESAEQLLRFPDDTAVMGQWRGEWKSDFFQFTVGQYRKFMSQQMEPLKTATNVTRMLGPRGGLRYLAYEYKNEQGVSVHTNANAKDEVARLEAFFAENGSPIRTQIAE